MSTDVHVAAAKLQKAIEEHLGVEGGLVFDFTNEANQVKLNLITVNSRHNQSFLFHTEVGLDRLDALRKMLEYLKSYRDKENTYTIQWRSGHQGELHTSYFRARNIYEALDKLYFGRDLATITVYNVVMNPQA
ncbi:MAG: hypothetical protein EAZ57_02610 [Cytophagales bacterium]|nr:MAG: hypothetical protein EAZ67_03075 [Cytophagales bacterium]TAF61656.1 MAG: hypothetical protein EAZ57_02610 [Cytophagales bacterium]